MLSTIVSILLLAIIILQIASIYLKKNNVLSGILVTLTGILLLINIIIRSIKIAFPAVTNTYEGLIFLSSIALISSGVMNIKKVINKEILFGVTIVSLIILAVASSPIIPNSLNPPIPALQSKWLILHVSFSFIGQAFFTVSFIAGILALLNKKKEDYYANIVVKSIYVGYPFYAGGAIVFGSIWASAAWGSFWSWDPKETWALITALIYTVYLHGRYTKYIKGKFLIILSIIGYLVSIFTFLGVNFLLKSLHSYT